MNALLSLPMQFWHVLAEMAPYLLFGFLVAGILAILVPPESVERHLGGKGFLPVLKASAFGVPLPLCSCGVIPVTASLRRHGASRGAATAFLLSTPQTGIDSILVTYALLGPVFAIYRPLTALVTGLVGGGFVNLFGGEDGTDGTAAPPCTDSCCAADGGEGRLTRLLRYGFDTLPRDIGRPLLVGLAVAALLGSLVPDGVFRGALGSGPLAMLLMMAVGIPIYVCATASIPVAAVLIAKGVSPGTALVFLMTGPATNAAALATLWKVLGRRTAMIYLATVAGCAMASGLLFDALVATMPGATIGGAGHAMPGWLTHGSAILLLLILGRTLVTKGHDHASAEHDHRHGSDGHAHDHGEDEHDGEAAGRCDHGAPRSGEPDHGRCRCGSGARADAAIGHDGTDGDDAPLRTERYRVEGMRCSHCAETIRRNLGEVAGISSVEVDLAEKELRIEGRAFDRDEIFETVKNLGYSIALK